MSSTSPLAIRMTWTAQPITSLGLRFASGAFGHGVRKARLGMGAKTVRFASVGRAQVRRLAVDHILHN